MSRWPVRSWPGVRALVRDGFSQLVGYGLSKLAQLLSLVLAPKAIGEICAKVAEWTAKIGTFLKNLISSMGKLGKVLDDIFGALGTAVSKIKTVDSSDYDFNAIEKAVKEGTAVGGGTSRAWRAWPTPVSASRPSTRAGSTTDRTEREAGLRPDRAGSATRGRLGHAQRRAPRPCSMICLEDPL